MTRGLHEFCWSATQRTFCTLQPPLPTQPATDGTLRREHHVKDGRLHRLAARKRASRPARRDRHTHRASGVHESGVLVTVVPVVTLAHTEVLQDVPADGHVPEIVVGRPIIDVTRAIYVEPGTRIASAPQCAHDVDRASEPTIRIRSSSRKLTRRRRVSRRRRHQRSVARRQQLSSRRARRRRRHR